MPRLPREEGEGAIHHVFDRGNNRQTIFHDDVDRRTLLTHLGSVGDAMGWNCLAYCLLGNHFHLLVETPQPNLGRGMQKLLSAYVQTFHARHGSQDALFGRRYGSRRVKDDVQFWTVVSYIAMNPVKAGLSASPEDWAWSSHAAIVAGSAPRWLSVSRLLEPFERFGRDPLRTYRQLVHGATAAPRPT